MASETDMKALHGFIRGLSDEIDHHKTQDHRAEMQELAKRMAAVQERMLSDIMNGIADRLERAAVDGERSLTILEFKGADMISSDDDTDDKEELSVLYVVKGPRDPAHRAILKTEGVQSLLQRLRAAFSPFAVRHAWDQATNTNTITVEW